MIEDGAHPIIFCRFIPTAEYLAEQLRRKLPDVEVDVVTGNLCPRRSPRSGCCGSGRPFQTRLDPPPARGWTPPEVAIPPPPTEAPFALEMVDSRPQSGLFDLE